MEASGRPVAHLDYLYFVAYALTLSTPKAYQAFNDAAQCPNDVLVFQAS